MLDGARTSQPMCSMFEDVRDLAENDKNSSIEHNIVLFIREALIHLVNLLEKSMKRTLKHRGNEVGQV